MNKLEIGLLSSPIFGLVNSNYVQVAEEVVEKSYDLNKRGY